MTFYKVIFLVASDMIGEMAKKWLIPVNITGNDFDIFPDENIKQVL